MTEHDANAPLTEEDVAAIEAALVDYEEGVAYDKKRGEIPRGLDVHVDADDVRRLVAEVRRMRAELARLQDIHDNSNLAYERLIREYRAEIERLKAKWDDLLSTAHEAVALVDAEKLPEADGLRLQLHDYEYFSQLNAVTDAFTHPAGDVNHTEIIDGKIPYMEPPKVVLRGEIQSDAPRFRVGQRVRQKADATPREGVVVGIDMHFPLLNGQTLPCANIQTDEGETFWWALDYLEDAT